MVVRAAKEVQRKDGSLIRFDDNACVLINKTGDPIGTRLTSKTKVYRDELSKTDLHFQALLEQNYGIGNGLRSCRSRRYMYKSYRRNRVAS